MKLSKFITLSFFLASNVVLAATTSSSSSDSTSSSSDSEEGATTEKGIVPFLQTLQTAQISSMSCLIALVNMTQNPIGSCLNLKQFAPLVIGGDSGDQPGRNETAAFDEELQGYLNTACKGNGCNDEDIQEARGQLQGACGGQQGNGFIPVLDAVLGNYQTSFKTMACSIAYNGTQSNCLVDAFASNRAANNNQFFKDLLSGGDLGQYTDSVFKSTQCSGCMHELYKAAVFLIPAIRTQGITSDMGDHLKNDCGGGPPNWETVTDQQMPEALVIKQNPNSGGSTARSGAGPMSSRPPMRGVFGLVVAGGVYAVVAEMLARKGYA